MLSVLSSPRTRSAVRGRPLLAAAAVVALAGCVDHVRPLDETTSLRVELIAPADVGAPERDIPQVTTARIRLTAIDAQNQVDVDFAGMADVYVQYLGSLTPERGAVMPLAKVPITAGVSAETDVPLPAVYGPTVIWAEDDAEGGSYPTGTSPTMWFRDPFMNDISTPRSLTALDALVVSPLQNKQVTVSGSRYGARGRLIVTGVYAQGYTLSDSECADAAGNPPCTTGDFDHVLIFSFSRPRDERGNNIAPGQFITGFAGSVQEFNGLTEIGFPQSFTDANDPSVDLARIPPPAVVQPSWFTQPIEFEKRESGLIAAEGGIVCPLDDDFTMYKQWKLDVGRGCGQPINVITNGVADFDPATRVGMPLTRVVGSLRPVNLPGFNVWIVYPRGNGDVVL